MSNSYDFTGKVVLITGSSSGIGAAIAQRMCAIGAQVVVTGRNRDKIASTAQKCYDASVNGKHPLEVVADVTNEDDCSRLVQSTIDYYGKLDLLINNAGCGAMTTLSDPNLMQVYDTCMKVNLRSVVYMTYIAVPHLLESRGSIINISSVAGLRPLTLVYSMAKSALNMFTKCLAMELGPQNVRVNSINPSSVKTNFATTMGFNDAVVNGVMERYAKLYPIGRIGHVDDIANAAIFLASDDSSFITGINFIVDGGALWGASYGDNSQ